MGVKEDLKKVYRQKEDVRFREALQGFKEKWGRAYPEIVSSWVAELEHLVTYLRYPEEIRWLIYTTNPLERCSGCLQQGDLPDKPGDEREIQQEGNPGVLAGQRSASCLLYTSPSPRD